MNFSKLDDLMERLLKTGFPLADLCVTKNGKEVYRKFVGYRDEEKNIPMNGNEKYWIFSASKVITCIATLRLVEEGKISLSDPVSKYIPEYANLKVLNKDKTITDVKNTLTIEHLFTMTGGLDYDIHGAHVLEAKEKDPSTLNIVKSFAKKPLSFEPGTRYKYSLCHDVLAAIVEVVTGMKFSEYLQKTIFNPLGLKNIGFRPTEEQLKDFPDIYDYKSGTNSVVKRVLANQYRLSNEYDSGGAGLFSCVEDYMKIISVIACGGITKDGYKILSSDTISMMEENRLSETARNDFAVERLYGYGWGLCGRVHINPTVSFSKSPIGEFGWDGAAGAFVMVDTKNEIALFLATHNFGAKYLYNYIHPIIRNLVYEGLEEK